MQHILADVYRRFATACLSHLDSAMFYKNGDLMLLVLFSMEIWTPCLNAAEGSHPVSIDIKLCHFLTVSMPSSADRIVVGGSLFQPSSSSSLNMSDVKFTSFICSKVCTSCVTTSFSQDT